MNEYSDDFKGVRFPRDLWLDKNISLIEKGILVVIRNLDKSDDHCRATNNYLAEFFQCSISTVKRAIGHLKELKYIEETEGWKVGVCRKLKVIIDIENYPAQNEPGSKWTQFKLSQGVGQNDLGGGSNWPGYPAQNDPLIIYNNSIYNNINNNIGEQENFSNADASPSSLQPSAETKLWESAAKPKRKTKKQQRYDEVMTSVEFNTTVLEWITNEVEKEEIKTLWSEYVELRCSKDYRAFTDGAVKRNLKVLEGTTFPERKAILDKSVTKGWTWLFPLNEYDMKRIEWDLAKVEWSDEWLYDKIFTTKCKEKEDELPEWSTHDLLMELVDKYWEERVKKIYYGKVRPKIEEIYWIKRDWVK